ncbi:hypothetical protein BDZ89DRAFT_1042405 [Hymenopellis radicata]|nr:hypothetical protein BDZ89DRAFT_1042405 [Hymenopellis radicata]
MRHNCVAKGIPYPSQGPLIISHQYLISSLKESITVRFRPVISPEMAKISLPPTAGRPNKLPANTLPQPSHPACMASHRVLRRRSGCPIVIAGDGGLSSGDGEVSLVNGAESEARPIADSGIRAVLPPTTTMRLRPLSKLSAIPPVRLF